MFWKKTIAGCGHVVDKKKGEITLFWKTEKIKIIAKKPTYCWQCLEKNAIVCGRCGDLIFLGQAISILPAKIVNKKVVIPTGSIVFDKKNVMVCAKRDCMGTLGNCMGCLGPNGTIDDKIFTEK